MLRWRTRRAPLRIQHLLKVITTDQDQVEPCLPAGMTLSLAAGVRKQQKAESDRGDSGRPRPRPGFTDGLGL